MGSGGSPPVVVATRPELAGTSAATSAATSPARGSSMRRRREGDSSRVQTCHIVEEIVLLKTRVTAAAAADPIE